jgi:hypothetical protein
MKYCREKRGARAFGMREYKLRQCTPNNNRPTARTFIALYIFVREFVHSRSRIVVQDFGQNPLGIWGYLTSGHIVWFRHYSRLELSRRLW